MPLPEKEPITFKGAKPGDAEAVAISLTLTQKQVEAMFMRKEELKDSESPLKIDFDNKKLIIGDLMASFTMALEESGYRELCRRAPTGIDPLKPITTWGTFMGKLNIQRMNDEEVASNVRKVTEAENLKRSERTIVRLDTPPPVPSSGKKSKTSAGASALAKKAMSNRSQATASRSSVVPNIVSSSSRPASTSSLKAAASSVTSNPVSKPSPSPVSSSYDVKEAPKIDLDTPRSRAIHGLGANLMSPPEFKKLLSHMSRRSVDETTSQNLLQEIAEPSPKDSLKWQLKANTWREVRPNEAPDLTAEDRQTLRRKGRIALQLSPNDPLWICFQTDLSDKGETSRNGGIFTAQKALSARPGKPTAGTIAKAKVPAKAKAIKQEDNLVETKAKKTAVPTADAKGKARAETSFIATLIPPTQPSKREEKQSVPSSNKPRASSESIKKEPSPLPPKVTLPRESPSNRKRKPAETMEDTSEIEEGELLVKEVRKRKISNVTETVRTESSSKQTSNRPLNGRDGKERARMSMKEELPVKAIKESSGAHPSRVNVPSSRTSLSSKDATSKKEPRDSEAERLRDREYEKRRSSTKRPRRATPSFSSSEGEVEEPPAKKRATTSSRPASAMTMPSSRTSTGNTMSAKAVSSSRAAPSNSKPPGSSRSYTVPADKDSIRREYQRRHPQYLNLKAKLLAQYAKVEELFNNLKETDSVSDTDLMEQDELDRLVADYKSLEHHLEQLTTSHTKMNTAY